jgi:uncharacterized membrane protein YdjX (TVP38/TMEM64 family)
MRIKDIIKNINWNKLLIGIIIGSIGGYAYYYFVGCQSGTCPIQSNPLSMTLYGAGMGAILFFNKKKSKTLEKE